MEEGQVRHSFQKYSRDSFIVKGKKRRKKEERKEGKGKDIERKGGGRKEMEGRRKEEWKDGRKLMFQEYQQCLPKCSRSFAYIM